MIKYIITSEVRTGHTGRTKVALERPQSRMVVYLPISAFGSYSIKFED